MTPSNSGIQPTRKMPRAAGAGRSPYCERATREAILLV